MHLVCGHCRTVHLVSEELWSRSLELTCDACGGTVALVENVPVSCAVNAKYPAVATPEVAPSAVVGAGAGRVEYRPSAIVLPFAKPERNAETGAPAGRSDGQPKPAPASKPTHPELANSPHVRMEPPRQPPSTFRDLAPILVAVLVGVIFGSAFVGALALRDRPSVASHVAEPDKRDSPVGAASGARGGGAAPAETK